MTSVVLGMLVSLGIAVAVLALVAVPRVREGERILTPDGEDAVRDARRRARAMAVEARERATRVADRPPAPAEVRLPEPDDGEPTERVLDLREPRRPEVVARQRIARALEWGEPEPGPRHRR